MAFELWYKDANGVMQKTIIPKSALESTVQEDLALINELKEQTITEESVDYVEELPSVVSPLITMNKLGGMSYKSENLLVLSNVAETTTGGITYKVENGVITLNGTATADNVMYIFNNKAITTGETFTGKLFINGNVTTNSSYVIQLASASNNYYLNGLNTDAVITKNSGSNAVWYLAVIIGAGDVFTNYVVKPMLVSGTTAPTEFKVGYEGIRDSAVTSVVSKDSNNTTLDTFTVPAEVQALTGYGWGINEDCYNYIDFERKVFVQKVGRVDLGTLSWNYNSTNNFYSSNGLANIIKKPLTDGASAVITWLCDTTVATYADDVYVGNYGIGVGTAGTLYFKNQNTSSSVQPVGTLYFELATPVETDISQYIDGNYLDVQSNGTLTFSNTYHQAVPFNYTYATTTKSLIMLNFENDKKQQEAIDKHKSKLDSLDNTKQDNLIDGTNIKTINNHGLTGSGNLSPSDLGLAEPIYMNVIQLKDNSNNTIFRIGSISHTALFNSTIPVVNPKLDTILLIIGQNCGFKVDEVDTDFYYGIVPPEFKDDFIPDHIGSFTIGYHDLVGISYNDGAGGRNDFNVCFLDRTSNTITSTVIDKDDIGDTDNDTYYFEVYSYQVG